MLSIDEAIMSEMNQHEFSDYNNYHEQLAEWLEELKTIKEMDLSIPQHFTKEQSVWIKTYCIKRNIEFYNKAIEDFKHELFKNSERVRPVGWLGYSEIVTCEKIYDIAEQLKAGDNNGT